MSGPPAGITLAEALERGAFHPLRAVHAGRDVAAILAETHRKGVVHGHVGPEDVLLGDDGVVRLSFSEEPGDSAEDVRALGAMLATALRAPGEHPTPRALAPLLEAMTDADPAARPTAAQVRDALTAMRLEAESPAEEPAAPARATRPAAPPETAAVPQVLPGDESPGGGRRSVVLALVGLALVALAVALLVYVLTDDDASAGESVGPGTAGTSAPATGAPPASSSPRPGAPDTDDLVERISAPPGSARQLDDDANGLGALTAAQLVRLGGGSAADQAAIVEALQDLGFQAAHARAWSRGEGGTYSVVVYRFRTAAGAEELLTRLGRERPGTAFESRTVDDAVSYSRRNGALYEQAGSFVRGAYFFDITLATPVEETDHATFDDLLAAQRDRAEDQA